jgi:Bacterial Ig domain
MWFFGLLSFFGFVILAIMSLVSAIRKTGKWKKYLLLSGASFLIMCVVAAIDGTNDVPAATSDVKTKEESKDQVSVVVDSYPKTVSLKTDTVEITGKVERGDALTLNDKVVDLDDNGKYTLSLPLSEGENNFKLIGSGEDINDGVEEFTIVREDPSAKLTLTKNDVSNANEFDLVGKTESGATVTVFSGDKEIANTTANDKGSFTIKVPTKEEGEHSFKVKASKPDFKEASVDHKVIRELSKKEKATAKRSTAKTIDYKQFNKNPDRLKGEYVKYTGQILQIMEGEGRTQIRLAVTQTSYGWDVNDIVFVEYDGLTDFVDEDIVTIYGEVFGAYSYTSQAGWEITLPAVIADSVE